MTDRSIRTGPLAGVKVIEFAGLGPGPFAGMMLSDLGANVVQIVRPDAPPPRPHETYMRGRERVALDLKQPASVDACLAHIERSDILFEGNRPGVMERLSLGPDIALQRNPALIYARMTGWGQTGPLAHLAGHDINYLAVTGLAHAIGPAECPAPPLNLCADYGGGAMFLVTGILAALLHSRATGCGQVVDVAMTDCTAYLGSLFHAWQGAGLWQDRRAVNLLDGGAPFYANYACSDGKFVAVGALEPQFYRTLLEVLNARTCLAYDQMDEVSWPFIRGELAAIFSSKTRDEWIEIFAQYDACISPVLSLAEARDFPHMVEREVFQCRDGAVHVAPAARFSKTPASVATD